MDLKSDKIDVFFGLNPAPERANVIDFPVPVLKNSFSMIVRKTLQAKTWADFNRPDMRIAVDAGSAHDAVAGLAPKAQIIRLQTQSDATAALQSGRADAQCLVLILALSRARTGMVFQSFNLFPHMTVLQNVMEAPVQVQKLPRAHARDLALAQLEKVGLADRVGQMPDTLSGGQKQRVGRVHAGWLCGGGRPVPPGHRRPARGRHAQLPGAFLSRAAGPC